MHRPISLSLALLGTGLLGCTSGGASSQAIFEPGNGFWRAPFPLTGLDEQQPGIDLSGFPNPRGNELIADLLASRGVPFREAHEIVGHIVRWCEERDVGLDALDPETAAGFHPALAEGLAEALDPRAAAERRASAGGTAWSEVERQVRLLRESISGAARHGG